MSLLGPGDRSPFVQARLRLGECTHDPPDGPGTRVACPADRFRAAVSGGGLRRAPPGARRADGERIRGGLDHEATRRIGRTAHQMGPGGGGHESWRHSRLHAVRGPGHEIVRETWDLRGCRSSPSRSRSRFDGSRIWSVNYVKLDMFAHLRPIGYLHCGLYEVRSIFRDVEHQFDR